MDTSLLAVADVVAETEGLGAAANRSSERRGPSFASLLETDLAADRPHPLPENPDEHNSPHAAPVPKTDNMQADAGTNPADAPSNNSPRLADRPAVAETRPQPARSQEVEKEGAVSDPPNPPEVVKPWLSQYSQTVQHGKDAQTATMQPRAGFELAQMIADLHGRQIGLAAANAVKPTGLIPPATAKRKTDSATALPGPLADLNQALGKSNQSQNGRLIGISAKTSIAAGVSQQGGPKTNSNSTPDLQSPQTPTDQSPVLTRSVVHARVQETLLAAGNRDSADAPDPALDKASISNQLNNLLLAGNRDAQAQTGSASPNHTGPLPAQSQAAAAARQNSALPLEQTTQDNQTAANSYKKLKAGQQKQTLDSALTTASSKKLNPGALHLQARPAQTKNPGATASKDGSQSHLDRMLLQNNGQAEVTKPSSAVSAHAAKTAATTMQQPDSPARQVTEYIQSSLRPGDRQITIRLNPPELGRVLIKFEEQQQQITGLLEVNKLQTRHEIEQALPQIIRTLHDAGVNVKRLEVVLNDQAEQQNLKDQSQYLHDGFMQKQNSAHDAGIYDEPADEWLTNDNASPDDYQPQSFVSEDSINVLL